MKTRIHFIALCGMAILLFAACSAPVETKPKIDLEKLRMEIQQMEDAYAAAEKKKDAEGVAAYYTDDAISYNRNEEPTSGKSAIKERIAQRLAKDTTGNTNVYKVIDLFADGDMAVEIGSWTVVNPTGTEVEKGHYMSYFQKHNGKYLCARDMNVSSKPEKEEKEGM
jgi:uncharacterized protein (TIGR02246 family)